ncbi:protein of unknown function [Georgfuchsia toluolica]|uniref:Uncharacterized protein n=1 Tax=Georgfuchsia toluolica TaxID=424218 RepID=A0A916J2G7_9PROT|nr:protein of unknown function [Georgfuchsia toluolica]
MLLAIDLLDASFTLTGPIFLSSLYEVRHSRRATKGIYDWTQGKKHDCWAYQRIRH